MALKILLSSVLLFLTTGCKSSYPDKAETAVEVAVVGAVMLPFIATDVVGSLFSEEKEGDCRIEIGMDLTEVLNTFGSPEKVLETVNDQHSGAKIYEFKKKVQLLNIFVDQYNGSKIEGFNGQISRGVCVFYIVEKYSKVIGIYTRKERMTKKYL